MGSPECRAEPAKEGLVQTMTPSWAHLAVPANWQKGRVSSGSSSWLPNEGSAQLWLPNEGNAAAMAAQSGYCSSLWLPNEGTIQLRLPWLLPLRERALWVQHLVAVCCPCMAILQALCPCIAVLQASSTLRIKGVVFQRALCTTGNGSRCERGVVHFSERGVAAMC